jgi:hypothetical protein
MAIWHTPQTGVEHLSGRQLDACDAVFGRPSFRMGEPDGAVDGPDADGSVPLSDHVTSRTSQHIFFMGAIHVAATDVSSR